MNVNTYENEMIGQTVDDAAFSALASGQTCQLPICVIEGIREDMQRHANDVCP